MINLPKNLKPVQTEIKQPSAETTGNLRTKAGLFFSKLMSARPDLFDIIFYVLVVGFCYFCFNHRDLLVIGGWAFTYLNGHILDFYEATTKAAYPSNYLPSTNILFAVWNLPLYLLGIVTQTTTNVGYAIFWYKLLPTLFFAGSAFLMYKIGREIGLGYNKSLLLMVIWISCPLLCFSQFIFGQIDIITAFFMLGGVLFYLRKNIWLFLLFFGISFTFKFFAAFIFVPLLLLIEKHPLKLIGYLALSLIPVFLEILPYMQSATFWQLMANPIFSNRLFQASIFVQAPDVLYIFPLLWLIVCGICYYIKTPADKAKFDQTAIYMCLAAWCIFFSTVYWHPQWLMLLTPFLAITTFMHKKIKYFLLLDFLLMVAFVLCIVQVFPHNVDQHLFGQGILGKYNPGISDPTEAFTMRDLLSLPTSSVANINSIYYTIIFTVLFLNALLKYPAIAGAWVEEKELAPASEYWVYARLRFFGGLAAFIIPAFIVYFQTLGTI